MSTYAIEVENLSFRYVAGRQPVLRSVNLAISPGQIHLLMGPTGAGKSTLYLCLTGLVPHLIRGRMVGKVTVAGLDTGQHGVAELAQHIGLVFQNPETQLFSMTVEDELAFGPENLGLAKSDIRKRISDAVTAIRLSDLMDREPAHLSGGQQQTVAIGAIWTMLPEVLILDEPTSNLDPQSSVRVLKLIQDLNREHGKTILMAEHKIDEVAPFVDFVHVMHQGQVVMSGPPREVFAQTERLHEFGVVAPAVAEVAARLRADGCAVERLPLTVEEGLDAFARLMIAA